MEKGISLTSLDSGALVQRIDGSTFFTPHTPSFFSLFLCVAFVSFIFMEEKIQAMGRPQPCKVYV